MQVCRIKKTGQLGVVQYPSKLVTMLIPTHLTTGPVEQRIFIKRLSNVQTEDGQTKMLMDDDFEILEDLEDV